MAGGSDRAQVWGCTEALSYGPGDEVALHGMSSAPVARVTVARDGLAPTVVLRAEVAMAWSETPADCCRVEPLCGAWLGRVRGLPARALVAARHRAGVWGCLGGLGADLWL